MFEKLTRHQFVASGAIVSGNHGEKLLVVEIGIVSRLPAD
jgi:hypothetical protein